MKSKPYCLRHRGLPIETAAYSPVVSLNFPQYYDFPIVGK